MIEFLICFEHTEGEWTPKAGHHTICYFLLNSAKLYQLRQPLRKMFASEEFNRSTLAKKSNGVKAKRAMLSTRSFLGKILFCFSTTLLLMYVLGEMDSNVRLSMSILYDMFDTEKEKIRDVCGGSKRKYTPYWNLINQRWTGIA